MTRKNWIILAIIGLSILLPFIFWLRLHRFDWIDYSISEGSLIAWGILAGIALLTRTILYIIVTTVTLVKEGKSAFRDKLKITLWILLMFFTIFTPPYPIFLLMEDGLRTLYIVNAVLTFAIYGTLVIYLIVKSSVNYGQNKDIEHYKANVLENAKVKQKNNRILTAEESEALQKERAFRPTTITAQEQKRRKKMSPQELAYLEAQEREWEIKRLEQEQHMLLRELDLQRKREEIERLKNIASGNIDPSIKEAKKLEEEQRKVQMELEVAKRKKELEITKSEVSNLKIYKCTQCGSTGFPGAKFCDCCGGKLG
ncbi:MAG: hypothetical protein FWE13_04855 [Firmicutes bacterium]|nr:hypothetical protein [Bacillota bacterium]